MKGQEDIPVLAAVIHRGSQFLVAQRPLQKRHGGLWEFPGGKLIDGESFFDAAVRELREELALKVTSVDAPMFSARDPNSSFTIHFCRVGIEGEPQALEHASLAWVTLSELLKLPLAPSDAQFAREGLSRNPNA